MGRKKKEPGEGMTYITAGFTPRDLRIIERTMDTLGVSQSAAIRLLLRAGARGPASSPFTPIDGIDNDHE